MQEISNLIQENKENILFCSQPKLLSLKECNSQMEENKNEKDQNFSIDVQQSSNVMNNEECIRFLSVNDWKIESLQQWPTWENLKEQQRQTLVDLCKNEILFKEALQWLKEGSDKVIDDILKQEQFQSLKSFKKFKKWINNKKHYQKKKQYSQKQSVNNDDQSCNQSDTSSKQQQSTFVPSIQLFLQPLPILQMNCDNIEIDNLKDRSKIEWNSLIKLCEKSNYCQRIKLLQEHYFNDPIVFIERLREYGDDQTIQNMFSNLLALIIQLPQGLEKTSLFVVSCSFYNQELLDQNQKDEILNEVLQAALQKMIMEQKISEVNGLLRLVFVNNFKITQDNEIQLTRLMQLTPIAVNQFYKSLQKQPFNLRSEVIERLPKVGYIFSPAFLYILKQSRGEAFLKVPDHY